MLLLITALCVALLFPRPPNLTVPPSSAAATVAVAADGSFSFALRAVVVGDNGASYAPWSFRNVALTLQGANAMIPVAVVVHDGTLTMPARRTTRFTVRANIASSSLANLVPALSLIGAAASGAPTTVRVIVDFTPVYLGAALPTQRINVVLPLTGITKN